MKNLTLLLAATMLTFGLSACSDKTSNTPAVIETKNLPVINMVATHAIDLDVNVAQLTFVPNSVAPWLGRIILLDEMGQLYSTDIEGRDPKPVGTGKYIDIFGLAREAAPGVFLAITTDNQIEAFIESDDDGNFSPMIYSGTQVSASRFCLQRRLDENQLSLLTSYGEYMTLGLNISKTHINQEILSPRSNSKTPNNCKLHFPVIKHLTKDYTVQSDENSGLYLSYTAPMSPNQKLPILEAYHANIKKGLSVRGVEHIKHIATTRSNYGGGAYADGVMALVDGDENRIVFISLAYAERKLLEVVNLPKNLPKNLPENPHENPPEQTP